VLVAEFLATLARLPGDPDWQDMSRDEVALLAAETWAGIAGAVPFRVGSLVAAGALVNEMAERAGWRIDWDQTPLVEQLGAVERGHHAANMDQITPAVEVVDRGLAPPPRRPQAGSATRLRPRPRPPTACAGRPVVEMGGGDVGAVVAVEHVRQTAQAGSVLRQIAWCSASAVCKAVGAAHQRHHGSAQPANPALGCVPLPRK